MYRWLYAIVPVHGADGTEKKAECAHTHRLHANSTNGLHIIGPSFVGEDDVEYENDTERLAYTGKVDELLLGAVLCGDTVLLVELA